MVLFAPVVVVETCSRHRLSDLPALASLPKARILEEVVSEQRIGQKTAFCH